MAEQNDELSWLAQQYVLDELGAEAAEAFEARLADEEQVGAALAQAVQLVAALRTVPPTPADRPVTSSGWQRLAWGLAATAAAGAAVWLLPRTSTEVQEEVAAAVPQQAVELVSRWREARPDPALGSDRWTDDEQDAADDVPNWLLAAVSLEADNPTESPVQEN
jgi:hypothetical protein